MTSTEAAKENESISTSEQLESSGLDHQGGSRMLSFNPWGGIIMSGGTASISSREKPPLEETQGAEVMQTESVDFDTDPEADLEKPVAVNSIEDNDEDDWQINYRREKYSRKTLRFYMREGEKRQTAKQASSRPAQSVKNHNEQQTESAGEQRREEQPCTLEDIEAGRRKHAKRLLKSHDTVEAIIDDWPLATVQSGGFTFEARLAENGRSLRANTTADVEVVFVDKNMCLTIAPINADEPATPRRSHA